MKIFVAIICSGALLNCSNNHVNKLNSLSDSSKNIKIKDPLLSIIPDSMKHWAAVLQAVDENDQKYRSVSDPHLLDKNLSKQNELDSKNLIIVSEFLDKYGWPQMKTVGLYGKIAVFEVIQHAPLEIQEKYYPMLVKACKEHAYNAEQLVLLEDRINMQKKRFQYYGTQLVNYKGHQILYPVYNVDSLDYRRKEMRLSQDITSYLIPFSIKWNLADYKTELPNLIEYFKVNDSLGLHFMLEN